MKPQLLALVGLFSVALSAPAAADDYFGAIAFSTSSGALGWSYDYGSRDEAEEQALQQCGGGCRVVLWFKNACGAIATSSDHSYGSGWATSRRAAEEIAMNGCSKHADDCNVERWVCTTR